MTMKGLESVLLVRLNLLETRNPMTVAGWGIQREGSSQLAGRLQQVSSI